MDVARDEYAKNKLSRETKGFQNYQAQAAKFIYYFHYFYFPGVVYAWFNWHFVVKYP